MASGAACCGSLSIVVVSQSCPHSLCDKGCCQFEPIVAWLLRGPLRLQDKFFARWAAYIDPDEREQIVARVAETAQLVAESRRG